MKHSWICIYSWGIQLFMGYPNVPLAVRFDLVPRPEAHGDGLAEKRAEIPYNVFHRSQAAAPLQRL